VCELRHAGVLIVASPQIAHHSTKVASPSESRGPAIARGKVDTTIQLKWVLVPLYNSRQTMALFVHQIGKRICLRAVSSPSTARSGRLSAKDRSRGSLSPLRIPLFLLLGSLVCGISTALGWRVGALSTFLYVDEFQPELIPQRLGGWFGSCSGLIVGLAWYWVVISIARRGTTCIRSTGGLVGLGAGTLLAALLHSALMVTGRVVLLRPLAVSLGLAAPVGLVLGMICAHLFRSIVSLCEQNKRPFAAPPREFAPLIRPLPEPDLMEQLDVRCVSRPHSVFHDQYDA
jgi:hypothetical protein